MELKKLKETDQEIGEDVDEKEIIKKNNPELFPQQTKEFPCHICHLVFNRKFNRDKHIELIHRIPRPERPPLYPKLVEYQEEPVIRPKDLPPTIERQEPIYDIPIPVPNPEKKKEKKKEQKNIEKKEERTEKASPAKKVKKTEKVESEEKTPALKKEKKKKTECPMETDDEQNLNIIVFDDLEGGRLVKFSDYDGPIVLPFCSNCENVNILINEK